MRDVGVIMDPKLKFAAHMEYVKMKADSKLVFVKSECSKTLNVDNAELLHG